MAGKNIAIVTGANKGLGFELIKGLCTQYNGQVFLTSRDENKGKAAVEKLRKMNLYPNYHQLDITNENSIKQMITHISDQNLQVDILINNAGVFFVKDAKESMIYKAEECVKVNFTSVVNFTEAILPFIKNGGKIVNISSSSGHLSRIPSLELRNKFKNENLTICELKDLMKSFVHSVREDFMEEGWGESAYVVSKVGLNAYTFLLHRRLYREKGVIVNCVHPGYLQTDMTHGAGTMLASEGARVPLHLALHEKTSGNFFWHEGTQVQWDGADPRGFIDGML